ncbi:iron ABC transporter permease [Rathayibacter sp. VKM Ac-2760]|uniref:FecCD family ABC transporter permease n=1 Tax=Rathayibacter sp. VKM Ac-2760 TaxID=2609253 RepID=UPI001317BED5|nr:iron ABC transporter permease [Rathayibacter sp. VKM Ac-2760]QHC58715.1 iron chelate uptake ABC transporter family permease subunit [Rathayibacter sp. VKM Ac-2760]
MSAARQPTAIRSLRLGGLSTRVRPRRLGVAIAATAAAALIAILSLGTGDYTLSPAEVAAALLGHGDRRDLLVVQVVRLPRILTGLAVGAALAIAGAITLTTARNTLATPDLLGVTGGASAGAVAVITLGGTASASGVLREIGVPTAALGGALVASALVVLLTGRTRLTGIRPLLVGLGVTAFFTGVINLLLIVAPIKDAARANVWLTGSLNQRSWPEFWPVVTALAVGVIILVPLAHRLGALHLGPDVARALGTAPGPTALVLLVVAGALTAVSAAAVGPLGFVALVAPHAARLATGASHPPLAASAAVGALFVAASDLVARTAFAPITLPAGAVVAIVGGPVLAALLITRFGRRA